IPAKAEIKDKPVEDLLTEKIDIESKGEVRSPTILNPVEQREKIQRATVIKKELTPRVSNPTGLYKSYKRGDGGLREIREVEAAIDQSNNEIVNAYLTFLENVGDEESLSKKKQKESEWKALNEAL